MPTNHSQETIQNLHILLRNNHPGKTNEEYDVLAALYLGFVDDLIEAARQSLRETKRRNKKEQAARRDKLLKRKVVKPQKPQRHPTFHDLVKAYRQQHLR